MDFNNGHNYTSVPPPLPPSLQQALRQQEAQQQQQRPAFATAANQFFPPPQSQPQGQPQPPSQPPRNVRRRGARACRRCRQLRTKCVVETPGEPCQNCRLGGPEKAAECQFPPRGERDVDRQFRRRPQPSVTRGPGSPSSSTQPPNITAMPPPATTAVRTNAKSDGGFEKEIPPISPPHSIGNRTPNLVRSTGIVVPSLNALPPVVEVIEGVRVFTHSYFQLGFIAKERFLHTIADNLSSVSTFLLVCILAISARFTPSLVRRYGSGRTATDHFLEAARAMVPFELYDPSLERVQAFFLLAIAQWGQDEGCRSSMDMGIAVRMATVLRLHSEDFYILPPGSSHEDIIRKESARRVFWMIQSQENLHSGYNTPAPFPLEDVTTLLPCDEREFTFGEVPIQRAALQGTPPAIANPDLVFSDDRCLFATLIQAHSLWGRVARRACRTDYSASRVAPWETHSDYQITVRELWDWEQRLPASQTFSTFNLGAWRSESLHLAYLSVTMVLRLANIVARRVYLNDMLAHLTDADTHQAPESETPTMASRESGSSKQSGASPYQTSPAAMGATNANTKTNIYGPSPAGFWAKMADELFDNVHQLHDQIDDYFKLRIEGEGFPQILVFCVYMCGSLSSHLWRYPSLCPRLSGDDFPRQMTLRCFEVLKALHGAWPTSEQWEKGLRDAATPLAGVSPAASQDTQTSPAGVGRGDGRQRTQPPPPPPGMTKSPTSTVGTGSIDLGTGTAMGTSATLAPPAEESLLGMPPEHGSYHLLPEDMKRAEPEWMLGELINVLPQNNGRLSRLNSVQMDSFPSELFDMELSTFLQPGVVYDPFQGLHT